MTIVWLEEVRSKDVSLVGGKGASLGEMMNAELPVPRGFAVTAPAFRQFLDETRIAKKLFNSLEIDVNDSEALKSAEKKAKRLILSAEMPSETKRAILDAYDKLCKREGEDVFVAIRSSATAEDLPDASFAGQQETFLNVRGGEAVVEAVQRCWASLYGARAIFYRVKQGFEHEHVSISVIIQKMVDADKAGVIFTSHPTSGEPLTIIEAGWGLGETVVSGSISPDNYVVDRRTKKIVQRNIATKDIMHVKDPKTGKTIQTKVPDDMRNKPVLTDAEVMKLTELGEIVENHYSIPQDVEWAIADEKIYMLQSRPITTIQRREEELKPEEAGEVILEGIGASPGLAYGNVEIVSKLDELDRVGEGDILVTKMTTPDMVPAMKRAVGIITDEGGLTCFTGDTRVLTDRGIIELEKLDRLIRSGEYVRVLSVNKGTLSPEWKRVLSSMRRTSNVWEVAVSQTGRAKHNTLKITPNHKMLTFDDRKLVERELEDLLDRNEAVVAVDRVPTPLNEFNGASGCSKDLAYLAGAIFSDGHIRLTNRRGSVTFRQKNIPEKLNYINSVREAFNREFSTVLTDYGEDVSSGVIRGREMVGSANRYICSQKKPVTRLLNIRDNLEEFILYLSEDAIVKFLVGFIDGDGSFNIAHESGRIHIYVGDELIKAVVLACLRLGILPLVSKNRTIYNVQIVEGLDRLLRHTQWVKGKPRDKVLGTKLFAASQILGDIVNDVNNGGKIKPYVNNNLLIGADKLEKHVLPLVKGRSNIELERIVNSSLRMQRIRKLKELGEKTVFNIEVEGDHNYIVFTEHLTPILVNNCHAAIVSRELGIPCIVGTKKGTRVLKDAMVVTIDGEKGHVYKGKLEQVIAKEAQVVAPVARTRQVTVTEVKVNISIPEAAERAAATGADGVGLLRIEHMILGLGKHPRLYIKEGKSEEYVAELVKGIRTVADAFYPRSVWVRTLDAPTDEFKSMQGGEDEPVEHNPMMGWRGIRRDLTDVEHFKLELQAFKKLYELGYDNVGIMLPLVQHPKELRKAKQIMVESGLDLDKIEFGIMIETPASALVIDQFIEEGLDFISFGTNDLTQYTLAVDRNNENVAYLYDEHHPAVLKLIEHVIKECNKAGVKTSICGQAGSSPSMARKLVELGITSISANIDAVESVREAVLRAEQRMLLDVARRS